MGKLAFCTVITQNYVPQAMTLYNSLIKHNREVPFYALIIDGEHSNPFYAQMPFTCLFLKELNINNIEHMVIYYDAFEMCNAVRPSLIKYLMTHYNEDKVIYLDSDIFVTGSFEKVEQLMDDCLFSFTPHITEPLPLDGKQPDDLQFLNVGLYNSGFWMFRRHERSLAMLDWLISRFEIYCFDNLERRMFCDQRLLPMLIQLHLADFKSLNNPEFNIAHWNLFQRDLSYHDNRYWVNDVPVVFFHLSGFDSKVPNQLTHHLHRMTDEKLELMQPLFQQYIQLLEDHAHYRSDAPYKYAYDQKTGLELTSFRRRYYFDHHSFAGVEKIERLNKIKSIIKGILKR